jgi:hypothetical protein
VLLLWLGGGKGGIVGVMRRVDWCHRRVGVLELAVCSAGVELGTWIVGPRYSSASASSWYRENRNAWSTVIQGSQGDRSPGRRAHLTEQDAAPVADLGSGGGTALAAHSTDPRRR